MLANPSRSINSVAKVLMDWLNHITQSRDLYFEHRTSLSAAFLGQLPRGNIVAPRFDCTTLDKVSASNRNRDRPLDALDSELRSRRALHSTVSCITAHTISRRNSNNQCFQPTHTVTGKQYPRITQIDTLSHAVLTRRHASHLDHGNAQRR